MSAGLGAGFQGHAIMARVRFYLATSLDGFIADGEGSVDWLAPYSARLYGYQKFLGEIRASSWGAAPSR